MQLTDDQVTKIISRISVHDSLMNLSSDGSYQKCAAVVREIANALPATDWRNDPETRRLHDLHADAMVRRFHGSVNIVAAATELGDMMSAILDRVVAISNMDDYMLRRAYLTGARDFCTPEQWEQLQSAAESAYELKRSALASSIVP